MKRVDYVLGKIQSAISAIDEVKVKVTNDTMAIRLKSNDIVIIVEPWTKAWYEYTELKGFSMDVKSFSTGNTIERLTLPISEKIYLAQTINQHTDSSKSVEVTDPVDDGIIEPVIDTLKENIGFYL